MIQPVPTSTKWQLEEGRRRHELIQRFYVLREQGATQAQAALKIGLAINTLRDWLKLYERANDWVELIPKVSTGRKSAVARLQEQIGAEATADIIAKVQAANLETGSNGGSWRYCTATMDNVPQPVVDVIHDPAKRSKHYIPRSLTRATRVTSANRLAFRGRRELHLNGGHMPRQMDVLPGDIFVIDDYTPTFGWWVPWPKSKDYPFGAKMLQGQLLRIVDYASLYCPGYALVAREHSSYRASDIWSFYGDIFRTVGLPRLGFQHEGGVFQANALRGVAVEYEKDEIDQGRRVGALMALPSNVLPCHRERGAGFEFSARLEVHRSILPKSKPIELAFSIAGKLEGMIWGSLGSDQRTKANAEAKRKFQACQRGAMDPTLNFLSMTEVMARLDKQMAFIHRDPMEGKVRQGRPEDLWNDCLAEHPLLKLPAELTFLYKPDWSLRTIRNSILDLSYRDKDTGERHILQYENAEAFANLYDEKVLVYHDRLNPQEPAEVATLDGRYLCTARAWSGTGAFIDRNPEGFEVQARFFSSLMRATSIIAKQAASRQLPPEIETRRKHAAAVRREEGRTPFSLPAAGSRATTPAQEPVAAEPLPSSRTAPAEGSPAPQPYRAMTWRERLDYDPDAQPARHSPPPPGRQKKTPLGSSRAESKLNPK